MLSGLASLSFSGVEGERWRFLVRFAALAGLDL